MNKEAENLLAAPFAILCLYITDASVAKQLRFLLKLNWERLWSDIGIVLFTFVN